MERTTQPVTLMGRMRLSARRKVARPMTCATATSGWEEKANGESFFSGGEQRGNGEPEALTAAEGFVTKVVHPVRRVIDGVIVVNYKENGGQLWSSSAGGRREGTDPDRCACASTQR